MSRYQPTRTRSAGLLGLYTFLAITSTSLSHAKITELDGYKATTVNDVCQPDPATGIKMHNGLPCATTTNYDDNTRGSCGFGKGDTKEAADWVKTMFTAAGNIRIYGYGPNGPGDDGNGGFWCGGGCGTCWELTPVGDACKLQKPDDSEFTVKGKPDVKVNKPITVMITNSCGDAAHPYDWCPNPKNPTASAKETNIYGFHYHFDVWKSPKFMELGWDNPVVTFKRVPCKGDNVPDPDVVMKESSCHRDSNGFGKMYEGDPFVGTVGASPAPQQAASYATTDAANGTSFTATPSASTPPPQQGAPYAAPDAAYSPNAATSPSPPNYYSIVQTPSGPKQLIPMTDPRCAQRRLVRRNHL